MSYYRRLAKQAATLLLQHGSHARAVSPTAIVFPEMHRAVHSSSIGHSQSAQHVLFSTSQPRIWPGCVPHLATVRQQQQQLGGHSCSQPVPLLAYRRPWRFAGGYVSPPAAAAGFTASTPAHGKPAEDDGPEGELHAVETAIRANALIFAAKLAVFMMSNSRWVHSAWTFRILGRWWTAVAVCKYCVQMPC